jgi:hypothetical protein
MTGMDQFGFDFERDDEDDDEPGEQQENLERVSSRIGLAVLDFCRDHQRFCMDELRRHIIRETGVAAPDSPGRILRDLRQRGHVGYKCVSRAESLYEVSWVKAQQQMEEANECNSQN